MFMDDMPRGGKRKGAGRKPLGDAKMVPIEIRLSRETLDAYEREADRQDVPRSQVIRAILEKHQPKKRR